MLYHEIDMSASPRKAHFDHFRHQPDPHVGLTVDVDVTDFVQLCKARGWSFYPAFIRIAAEAVPARNSARVPAVKSALSPMYAGSG